MLIYWAPVFHFYQPPTQFPAVLKKICQESYRPLIDLLGEFDRARATVNISGALTEMLADCGHEDILRGLRALAEGGRIELTGSAMYHPILPLLPDGEIRRQIALNQATNRRAFGESYRPAGFFPPELAYGPSLAAPITDTGHQWVLAGGVACPTDWPMRVVHRVAEQPRLAVLFRDDIISNRISFQSIDGFAFVDHLHAMARDGHRSPRYVVTAMDAETFGHHHREWERLFLAHVYAQLDAEPPAEGAAEPGDGVNLAEQHRHLLASSAPGLGPELAVTTVSDLAARFPKGHCVSPKASSWSTSGADLEAGLPYPLWDDPHNRVHACLWRHLRLGIELVEIAGRVTRTSEARRHADIARGLLDRALHSCQFWWASRRPMWDINMIERGLAEQAAVMLNVARAVRLAGVDAETRRAVNDRLVVAEDLGRRIRERLVTT